jgi:hypothetical protein
MEAGMSRRSVRATPFERTGALAGDGWIAEPVDSLTHAITINASRRAVWPWLAQMGAGRRAGWYSYDFLDNGGTTSATHILPELQRLAVGDVFPAVPGATDGFRLLDFAMDRYLVLGWVAADDAPPIVTWVFELRDVDPHTTRLIVRARAGHEYPYYGLPPWLGRHVLPVIHFVMERKQLLGIAARAEAAPAAPEAVGQERAA